MAAKGRKKKKKKKEESKPLPLVDEPFYTHGKRILGHTLNGVSDACRLIHQVATSADKQSAGSTLMIYVVPHMLKVGGRVTCMASTE